MKSVIVASGELGDTKEIMQAIRSAELLICADGGARHLRALDIIPHVMLGDFDSIRVEDKLFFKNKQVPIHAFPARKDYTDTELCVNWAIENHATDITLLGVTGTRIDHTLANIFLLKKLAQKGISARIINANNEIHMVLNTLEIKGRPGDLLSLIPVTQTVQGITLKGLEYPLKNARLNMGDSRGISNVFKENRALISLEKGILIVTRSRD